MSRAMVHPTCDADCTRMGWVEVLCTGPTGYDLHLSVPPDTDFDDAFAGFCHDDQEMVLVSGWLWHVEELVS